MYIIIIFTITRLIILTVVLIAVIITVVNIGWRFLPLSPASISRAAAVDVVALRPQPCISSFSMASQECYARTALGTGKTSSSGRCRPSPTQPFYSIPPSIVPHILTNTELDVQVLFVFIHINKSGGTTIKRQVIETSVVQHKWDAASFGTARGFRRLGRPWNNTSITARNKWGGVHWVPLPPGQDKMPEFFKCGIGVTNEHDPEASFLPSPPHLSCPLRFIWGSEAIGLCEHFPNRLCVYFTVLRHPIDRALSFYNYFCVNGEEHRKMWEPEWIQHGICPLNLTAFVARSGTTISEKLNRRPRDTTSCGVQVAFHNLIHPCFRYVLLDNFQDGMERLSKQFGTRLSPYFSKIAREIGQENQEHYNTRTIEQMNNHHMMEELTRLLRHDIELYEMATNAYEGQWDSPLESCMLPPLPPRIG